MFKPRLTLTFAKPSPLMSKRESPPCHSERSEESPPSLAQGGRGNAWSDEHPQRHSERSQESPPFASVRGLGGCLTATSPPRHPLRSRCARSRPLALKRRGHANFPRLTFITAIITILVLSAAISCDNTDQPPLIHAAASLVDVLTEVATQYQDETGNQVRFNFAGSNLIANQIIAGAPADAVILAGKTPIDKLLQDNKTTQTNTIQILSNTLVAVKTANSDATHQHPSQLIGAGRIAMPDPKTAPAGEYFQAALRELNLLEQLESQIVPTLDVRAALAAVTSGNVAYALVYQTDAISTDDVQIAFTFQSQSEEAMPRYYASIINDDDTDIGVNDFIDYLQSPTARSIFNKHGFEQ